MNEQEIRDKGFEAWYGGDTGPEDYDGEVLLRGGWQGNHSEIDRWCWKQDGSTLDIVGYKRKEPEMPQWVQDRYAAMDKADVCALILKHEEPPVDPDVALARKHYDAWMDGDYVVREAILAAIKEARNA